ncbi:head completion/stabilization protein [Serratia marcescens]
MKFVAPGKTGEEKQVIKNTQFWPDVDLSDLQESIRTDGTITPQRLRHAALNAIAEVNGELTLWRQAQQTAGFTALENVPAEELDDESVLLQHYSRAVYCITKANLNERYRDFDATGAGGKRADEMDESIDELWRDARWAMRLIQGEKHMTVELI